MKIRKKDVQLILIGLQRLSHYHFVHASPLQTIDLASSWISQEILPKDEDGLPSNWRELRTLILRAWMIALGLEPKTAWLKVRCSTNWATRSRNDTFYPNKRPLRAIWQIIRSVIGVITWKELVTLWFSYWLSACSRLPLYSSDKRVGRMIPKMELWANLPTLIFVLLRWTE